MDKPKLWPIKCPICGNEFTHDVEAMEAAHEIHCPDVACSLRFSYLPEQFKESVDMCMKGELDPWIGMVRLQKPKGISS